MTTPEPKHDPTPPPRQRHEFVPSDPLAETIRATDLPGSLDETSAPPEMADSSEASVDAGGEERFEILEVLGEGGMGTVYSAWDHVLEQEVALKCIRSSSTAQAEALERFKREARLARRIQHVNVAQMYDIVERNGVSHLCMEYVNGRTLADYVASEGRLPLHVALAILRQLCSGVQAAHDQGIIHRDLKPANVMVAYDSPRACILDFGIAQDLAMDDTAGRGIIVGSPKYMSPEQLRGAPVDSRTDVYALGLLLYEMVTGEQALPATNPTNAVQLLEQRKSPPEALDLVPDLPDYVAAIIRRCLSFEPEDRPTSPDEIVAVLDKHRRRSGSLLDQVKSGDAVLHPTVLVALADDEANQVVAGRVRALGCEVETATDGVSALKTLVGHSFNLIALDPHLTRLDGFAVHEVIQGLPAAELPWVVFLVRGELTGDQAEQASRALDVFRFPEDLDGLLSTAKMLTKL